MSHLETTPVRGEGGELVSHLGGEALSLACLRPLSVLREGRSVCSLTLASLLGFPRHPGRSQGLSGTRKPCYSAALTQVFISCYTGSATSSLFLFFKRINSCGMDAVMRKMIRIPY